MADNMTDNQKETPMKILEVAQRMFMEQGYRAVSTRQIADVCGITQPALYHHFKNKQALYIEVCRKALHETEVALNQINSKHRTVKERLYQASLFMLEHYQDDLTQMFHDIFNELDEASQKLLHDWWMKGFLNPVLQMIEEGRTNGEIKNLEEIDTTPVEVSFMILTIIKSAIEPSMMKSLSEENKTKKIKQKAKLIVEILCSGLSR